MSTASTATTKSIKTNSAQMSSEAQLERLCSREKWVNPYEVLLLGAEATDEEIKSRFKRLSLLVHPDKCPGEEPRALQAFHIIDVACKTLLDAEKRKVYQRVMREAKERVDLERRQENRRRELRGLSKLPEDTVDAEVQAMCNRIFREMEERKFHVDRTDWMESRAKRAREEDEKKREEDDQKKEMDKEWERSRDKRVNCWRTFQVKKEKTSSKKKMKGFEIRPPPCRMEERPFDRADEKTQSL